MREELKTKEMNEERKRKRRMKNLIIIGIIVICLFLLLFIGMGVLLRSSYNKRVDIPKYTTQYYYDHFEQDYPREEVTLTSGESTLHAYIYGAQNDKALLVFSHGSGCFHEDYMSQIIWFVDHGYRVFAPDYTGCGHSGGNGWGGLPQSVKDLDAVLTYIENDLTLSSMKKVLYGHSWGAYAVSAVLNFDHDVTAVVSNASYNQPTEQMTYIFSDAMGFGIFGKVCGPFIWMNEQLQFGKYGNPSASEGINRAGIPVMVVHGEEDDFVSFAHTSIIKYRDEITNDKVVYLPMEGYSHDDFFYSDAANAARKAFEQEKQNLINTYGDDIPDEELEKLYGNADKSVMNELNEDFFMQVTDFLDQAIGN